jgi:hypothetical protein
VRVYHACSPYHLILVGALQVGLGDVPATIIYHDQHGFLDQLGPIADAFPNVQLAPFHPRLGSTRWSQAQEFRKSANLMYRLLREGPSDAELYTCNSTGWDLRRSVQRLNGAFPVHYVEDGLDAYLPHSSHPAEKHGLGRYYANWMLYRVLYGVAPPDFYDMTAMVKFDKFHVVFPEICRSTIKQAQVERIERSWIEQSVERLGLVINYDLTKLSPTHVYFPGLSSHSTSPSELIDSIANWAASVRAQSPDNVCAVKLHPRERNQEAFSALDSQGIGQYPAWIPAELVMPSLTPGATMKMGLSTAILSSRVLCPDRTILLDASVKKEYADVLMRWDDAISWA